MESGQPGSSWGIPLQELVQKEQMSVLLQRNSLIFASPFLNPPSSVLVPQRGENCTSECLRSCIFHSGRETALTISPQYRGADEDLEREKIA